MAYSRVRQISRRAFPGDERKHKGKKEGRKRGKGGKRRRKQVHKPIIIPNLIKGTEIVTHTQKNGPGSQTGSMETNLPPPSTSPPVWSTPATTPAVYHKYSISLRRRAT